MTPADLLDASILIGLTFVDDDGSERLESYIGRVVELLEGSEFENLDEEADLTELVIECHDGETRTFPFEPDSISFAGPGIYKLPDGATIENPDYEMHWRINPPVKH